LSLILTRFDERIETRITAQKIFGKETSGGSWVRKAGERNPKLRNCFLWRQNAKLKRIIRICLVLFASISIAYFTYDEIILLHKSSTTRESVLVEM